MKKKDRSVQISIVCVRIHNIVCVIIQISVKGYLPR